jgi:hypothetical protein
MVAFPTTAWSSIDLETSMALRFMAATTTTGASTNSRLEVAATKKISVLANPKKISICNLL